jgi:hypothetical protein
MSSEYDREKRRLKLNDKRRRRHGDNQDGSRVRDFLRHKKRGAKVAQWEDD